MLIIVDYGVGNLASIKNMLKKAGSDSKISSHADDVMNAEKLILPGVGAFDTCALKLQESGLIDILNRKVIEEKIPLLGICVGMQLLMQKSEEGKQPGLGWIKGKVIRFKPENITDSLKIPHMGWTEVTPAKKSRLFDTMYSEPRFYFVHSYFPAPEFTEDVLASAEYGCQFTAAVEHENIMGTQFHPEKSHKFGLRLFENFIRNY